MDLVIVSNKEYEYDFRKHLIDAASMAGSATIHVRCWGDYTITVDRHEVARFEENVSVSELGIVFEKYIGNRRCIVLTGTNGFRSKPAKRLKKLLPNGTFIFDVYDDFRYGATGNAAFEWLKTDLSWRRHCHGQIVLQRSLKWLYPFAYHLNNASHLTPIPDLPPIDACPIVCIGSVDHRTRLDLIADFLKAGCAIDLYGSVHVRRPEAVTMISEMSLQHKNFRYFGQYNNNDLSDILSNYRIGLVPYVERSPITRYINPDKIYHYLNAGLEVITTKIPQALRMAKHVHLFDGAADVKDTILSCKNNPKANKWPVGEHTWTKRWHELKIISEQVSR
jgi:hypothetical protein